MKKKKLLFITPVNPLAESRGRNLRARQWVHYLSKKYDVTVICTSIYGEYFPSLKKNEHPGISIHFYKGKHGKLRRIMNMILLKPSRWNSNTSEFKKWIDSIGCDSPDIILCFRFEEIPKAIYLSKIFKCPEIWLDLDELESDVKSQIATLQIQNGEWMKALKMKLEMLLTSAQERRYIRYFSQLFATTHAELEKLTARADGKKLAVFENKLPVRQTEPKTAGHPFRFLFIGNNMYYPNLDAILVIANELIPALRSKTNLPFECTVIGGERSRKMIQVTQNVEELHYLIDTDDLEALYEKIDAVLIPLRAGGGSSFKVIEAMSYSKPVISTPIGVRGFELEHGKNVLIGETPDELADQCRRLIEDEALFYKLAVNGHRWFLENNSFEPEKFDEKEVQV